MNSVRKLAAWVPPRFAQKMKRVGAAPRFYYQSFLCRLGYAVHGKKYPCPILFIAGLPKSGTTWMERMLASFPGYHPLLIPQATTYELSQGGSHDYDLPADLFQRLPRHLAVVKMHAHGSPHNAALLAEAGVRYVILYRDLRDVAVSYYFYVRRNPFHPEHEGYRGTTVEEGLRRFADRLLVPYVRWVRSWEENRDPDLSLLLQYEELLADTTRVMSRVLEHFNLRASPERVRTLVDRFSFKRMSGGRERGQAANDSFFRQGVAGSWREYFTPELKGVFLEKAGDFLQNHGYVTEKKG